LPSRDLDSARVDAAFIYRFEGQFAT
jgi:hypothetical protein